MTLSGESDVIEVADSGIGAATEQGQDFGRFYQPRNEQLAGMPSVGLGLVVTRRIV